MVFRPPKTWVNAGVKSTDLNREVRDQIRALQKQILVLQSSSSAGTVSAGTIVAHSGLTIPTGWLLCDGKSTYSTTTYADLHLIIGYKYGGAGATFAVPDLRQKFARGNAAVGSGAISDRAIASGSDSTTVTQTLTVSNTVAANTSADHFHNLGFAHSHAVNASHNFNLAATNHAHNNASHGHSIGGSTANGNRGTGSVLRAAASHGHSTNTGSLGASSANDSSDGINFTYPEGAFNPASNVTSAYTSSAGAHAHNITHDMVFDHSHTADTLPLYADVAFVIKT